MDPQLFKHIYTHFNTDPHIPLINNYIISFHRTGLKYNIPTWFIPLYSIYGNQLSLSCSGTCCLLLEIWKIEHSLLYYYKVNIHISHIRHFALGGICRHSANVSYSVHVFLCDLFNLKLFC